MSETINTSVPLNAFTEIADGTNHPNGVTFFCENTSTPLEVIVTQGVVTTPAVPPFTLPTTNTPVTLRGIPTTLGKSYTVSGLGATDSVQVKPPPGISSGAGAFKIRIVR